MARHRPIRGRSALAAMMALAALSGYPDRSDAGPPPPVAAAGAFTKDGVPKCSGALYAPDRLATAAHCLHAGTISPDAARRIQFMTGAYAGHPAADFPLAEVFHHPLYSPADAPASTSDAAVVRLDGSVPPEVATPIPLGPPAQAGETLFLAAWTASGPPRAREQACRVVAADPMRMTLSCRVVSGNSGAPVLRKTPDGLEIAGIVIATGRRDGQRGPVTLAVQARSRILQIEAVSGP